jgi:predicted transcriptional regulator
MRKHESINFEFVGFPDTHRRIEGVYLFGENAYVGASIKVRKRIISHVNSFLRNAHYNKRMCEYLTECYIEDKPIKVTYLSPNVTDEEFYSLQIIGESQTQERFYSKRPENRKKNISIPDVKIFDWMPMELKLEGNKLLLYSLLFSWNKDFDGGLKYICSFLDCSKTTAIKTLKFLTDNDLIIKKSVNQNNTVFNYYSINFNKISKFI